MYIMASSSLALVFALSLWSTNSQRINEEKSVEGLCKSETDYLRKLEDLRILMMEQRNEMTGYQRKLEELKQKYDNKTEEFQIFRLQQTNITGGHQEELEKLRKDNQEIKNRLCYLEELWNTTTDECRDADFVGFTVTLEAQNLPQQDSIIKPSRFISQYTGSFSNAGEFLCIKDGVYVFFLHLVTTSRSNGAWIYKNDIPMTLTWQEGPSVSTSVSGTTSLVVDLRVGDKICIKSYKNNLSVNETSVWTGHLIFQKSNEYLAMQSTLKQNENSEVISGKEMITNMGNSNYSLETGTFVCTKSGYYKVDINTIMQSWGNGPFLYVNDEQVPGSLYTWHSQNGNSSCSTTAVLNLTLGDKITIKMIIAFGAFNLNTYSTFAIYLLSPLFDVDSGFSCRIQSTMETYIICINPITTLNSSGYFTCKEEGYYYLSVNLLTASYNNGIRIYRNEEPLTYAWIGAKWGTWDSASTSLVLHLKVGDYLTFRKMHGNLNIDPSSRVVVYKIHP